MQPKIQAMLKRASQDGHFPLSRRRLLFFEQHKTPKVMVLKPFWTWKLGLGHDVSKNRLSKMCCLPWRGAHFYKIHKFWKKNHAKKHQKTIAAAERADKKLCPPDLVKFLHQKCKLQHAFLLAILVLHHYFSYLFQNVLPALGGKHIFEKWF